MKHLLWLTMSAVATSFFMGTMAIAADISLKIGSGHPTTGFAYVMAADEYFVPEVIRRVKEKGYNIRFVKVWAGGAVKVDEIVEAVKFGTLDIGVSVPSFEPSRAPLLNVAFSVPFVSTDPILTQKVAARLLKEVPALQDSMKPYNIRILQMSVQEPYGVISAKEWSTLEQAKGRKIGVAASNSALYSAAGTTPVIVPAPDAYMAIKTGLIDGQVFFASGLEAFRLHEVAKYFINTGQGSYLGNAMYMNMDTRNRLPKEVVEIIDQVAEETSVKIAEISAQRAAEAEAKAVTHGVKVITLDEEQRRKWMEAAKPIAVAAAKEAEGKGLNGRDVFSAYVRFMREAGYTFPVDYQF